MRLLSLVVILISLNVQSNELPPGVDYDHQQKTRKLLGEWILGVPYKPHLRKDQELFERYNSTPITIGSDHKEYDPYLDKIQVFTDEMMDLQDAVEIIVKPLGFFPDFSQMSEKTLKYKISMNNTTTSLAEALTYIEYSAGVEFTIYPREAGGLIVVTEDESKITR